MKPTVQNNSYYGAANDYIQTTAFFDTSCWVSADFSGCANSAELFAALSAEPKYYKDGIYTKLADALSGDSAIERSGTWFKSTKGFNKRTWGVNSAAVTDADYDTAIVSSFGAL